MSGVTPKELRSSQSEMELFHEESRLSLSKWGNGRTQRTSDPRFRCSRFRFERNEHGHDERQKDLSDDDRRSPRLSAV